MIKIRPATLNDFAAIQELHIGNDMIPPAHPDVLRGICLVADKDGEVVGCIWALIGASTVAYAGNMAIKDKSPLVCSKLCEALFLVLRVNGIRSVDFFTHKHFSDITIRCGATTNENMVCNTIQL